MPVDIPNNLIEQMAEGKVVLFAGAGMSRPGLPGWSDLLNKMIDWARREKFPIAGVKNIQGLIKNKKSTEAAQEIRQQLGDNRFLEFMHKTFRDPALKPDERHKSVSRMKFAAILTTNFDKLIESAFPPATPWYTQQDCPELARLNQNNSFAIVKVHGDIDRSDSLVLGLPEYRKAMFSNEHFRIFLTVLFLTKTVLFVGCSLTDPDLLLFLEELKYQLLGFLGTHYALMETKPMNPLEKARFEKSYGIGIFGDDKSKHHPDIAAFLADLDVKAAAMRSPQPSPVNASMPVSELNDVRGLLEAKGYIIYGENPENECHDFLGKYAAEREWRAVLACYSSHDPSEAELAALHQRWLKLGVHECILITRENPPAETAANARKLGIAPYSREEFIDQLADFGPYLKSLPDDFPPTTARKALTRYSSPSKSGRSAPESRKGRLSILIDSSMTGSIQRTSTIYRCWAISARAKPGSAAVWLRGWRRPRAGFLS